MEIREIVLDAEDISIITEALIENEDTEIADSSLTDLFIALSKEEKSIVIKPYDDSFSERVKNVLDEIDFDEINEGDYWKVEDDNESCWDVSSCENCNKSCNDCETGSCAENDSCAENGSCGICYWVC